VIALYGATGYTGGLVTDELVRVGADFVLGGRSAEKLGRLSAERGAGAPVAVAAVDDPASLRTLLEGCDAVINCAGPFALMGEPVVEAAIATGTHYLDSTGEQEFMRRVFERQGAAAERAGVALVPAMGFDFVPGDCVARLVAGGMEPLAELTVAYDVADWGMSRGTLHTALEIMGGRGLVYRDGGHQPGPRGVYRLRFDFGPPAGAPTMAFYPSGEAITVPRHTRTRAVTTLMSARSIAPRAAAPLFPFLRPGLAAALRTPARRLLDARIRRLPEGPAPDARRKTAFTVVAEAVAEDGRRRRGEVTGRDVYGLTAGSLVWAARRMTAEGYDLAGALAPAEAFDPEELLEALAGYEVRWQLGVVADAGQPVRC